MALSNWDTLAVDESGTPNGGSFTSPMGVVVEFYKNWIYVSDAKAWREGGGYVEPIVMQVQSGEIEYQDVHVLALRGPQNGVYAAVWVGFGSDATGMIGCGVYGYDGHDFVGVKADSVRWFRDKLAEKAADTTSLSEPFEYDVYDVPDSLRRVDWSKALRFNQGDAYFAARVGAATPATEPGMTNPTILSRLLDGDR